MNVGLSEISSGHFENIVEREQEAGVVLKGEPLADITGVGCSAVATTGYPPSMTPSVRKKRKNIGEVCLNILVESSRQQCLQPTLGLGNTVTCLII